jgi:SAM-dependent methyltransferase
MDTNGRRAHWNDVYASRAEDEVSWFEESPTTSLTLIRATGLERNAAIVDVGAGASRLVDRLLDDGYTDLSVLDVSERALAIAQARLAQRASQVKWIAADVTTWQPVSIYDLWHDRAVFHFLVESADREAYVERLRRAVRQGGHAILGTFALDGPERCSGLPIVRYDPAALATTLGSSFRLVRTLDHEHRTPMGRPQKFQFSWFRAV